MEWVATPILSSENSCRDSYKTWAWEELGVGDTSAEGNFHNFCLLVKAHCTVR